jgi:S1-C subfamily serine protease
MTFAKTVSFFVALGLVAAALTVATPVYGQRPDPRVMRFQEDWTLLPGPGSQIGVTARDLDPAEVERLKVQGVYIETVREGSPAQAAGFRVADVVVEFDGERVRSLRQFTRLVRETPPERQVRAAVMRDGKRSELSVTPVAGGAFMTLDSRALREQLEAMTERIRPFDFDVQVSRRDGRLGIRVQELTPELAAYFGAKDGVLVAAVTSDSPAARAGIRAGDVITGVNGRSVGSAGDLNRELRSVTGDGALTLGVVRDKKETTLKATIDVEPERRARPARPARPVRPIGTTI